MIQIRLQKGSVTIAPLPAIQPVALQTDSRQTSTPGTFLVWGWLAIAWNFYGREPSNIYNAGLLSDLFFSTQVDMAT